MGVKFKAHLWKIVRDKDDEVTLVLKVPSTEAIAVIGLPTQEVFNVDITKEE